MSPRLKMHVLSYSSRWTNSSEGCECDGSPVWEDARESVENCVGSRRDVDQEDAGAAEEIWLRILRPEIWHQVCSQPPREVGSWNLLGCFFFLTVFMFRFFCSTSTSPWCRSHLKEHQKKVEQDPDFIRKKLKLNADGTPREKVVQRFLWCWTYFSFFNGDSTFITFLKVHKNTKMGSVQEHDNEAGPECFKCGQVKVLF